MLKNIMNRAWEIYKAAGCSTRFEFGLSLKAAWAEAKAPKAVEFLGVKSWLLSKNLSANQIYAYNMAMIDDDVRIERETEKAVLVKVSSEWGSFSFWSPKSCLITSEDLAAEEIRRAAAYESYEALVNRAKAMGIKGVRIGMKASTIREKMANLAA